VTSSAAKRRSGATSSAAPGSRPSRSATQ
jgi:hypothetical protein